MWFQLIVLFWWKLSNIWDFGQRGKLSWGIFCSVIKLGESPTRDHSDQEAPQDNRPAQQTSITSPLQEINACRDLKSLAATTNSPACGVSWALRCRIFGSSRSLSLDLESQAILSASWLWFAAKWLSTSAKSTEYWLLTNASDTAFKFQSHLTEKKSAKQQRSIFMKLTKEQRIFFLCHVKLDWKYRTSVICRPWNETWTQPFLQWSKCCVPRF